MPRDATSGSWPTTRTAAWLAGAVALAVWIDLGRLHRLHQADTIVPILVSLYRWTPYYWEQDRFGMLVPLLAWPVRSPFANLLVQDGLDVLAWVLTVALLARFVVGAGNTALVALLALFGSLVLEPAAYRFQVLVEQPYGVALAFALAGLLLVDDVRPSRARGAPAAVLLGVAHWVALNVAVLVGLLVVARAVVAGGGGELKATGRQLALIALAAFGGTLARHHVVGRATEAGAAPSAAWFEAWWLLATHVWAAVSPGAGCLVAVVAAATGLAVAWRRERGAVRAAGALAAAGVAYVLIVATSVHVRVNGFGFRYAIPGMLLAEVALATLIAAPFVGTSRRVATVVATVAVACAACVVGGMPSLVGVRRDLDVALGARTADVLASGATHVAGRYWNVWPTVFHANLVLHERGEDRVVWGVAYRCRPTQRWWRPTPERPLRVAVARDDPDAATVLRRYGFPRLVAVAHRPTIDVFVRPRDAPAYATAP